MSIIFFNPRHFTCSVIVPMVGIGEMIMCVRNGFMEMLVFVPFGQMQPEAQGHERSGDDQTSAYRFV